MRSYWLDAYFPDALARAVDQMPSHRQLQSAFAKAQLRVVAIEPWFVPRDPIDLFLYAGKHDPVLYLDERVRKGISTFANLADADEMGSGMERLKGDIATGEIARVMARYASDGGDYQFVVAQPVL
jgi:hypothetical protein